VLKAAQKNIKLRYSLSKWYYSLFIHKNGTGTGIINMVYKVFNPLFYVYPDEADVFRDEVLDTQFMLNRELMAAPILK
jgi:alpha-glucosidase/lysosomal alpha-glucosidase